METKAHHVLIGAFTLLAIAAAFLAMWYVSGAGGFLSGRIYRVEFKGSVGDLTNGSLVTFNGLRAGEVTSVGISPDDPSAVVARIKVDSGIPVRTDTVAKLESQGLGGSSTIALIGGSASAPELKGANGEPPLLQGGPSQMASLLANVASLSAKVDSVVARADSLLQQNSDAITDTVKNLDAFSKALGENAPALKEAIASIGDVGKQIGPVAESMNKLVASIDPDKIHQIVDNSADLAKKLNSDADKVDGVLTAAQTFLGSDGGKGVVSEVSDAAKSIKVLADTLTTSVKNLTPGLTHFGSIGLREYEALAVDGRRTVNDIDQLVRTIQTNPSKLFFGK